MNLEQDLQTETVADLALREAIAVRPATPVRQAVAAMRSKGLGCAIIVDAGGRPIGLFTERGLVRALARSVDLDSATVTDYAIVKFPVIKRGEPISRVWNAILHNGFRFVAVTDEEGKLIGLTGQRGLAEHFFEYFPQQVAVHRLGNTPWLKAREGA